MSQNIVINSSHWDASQKKFIYKLRFPQTYSNKQIGLSSVSMYNQFFNVSASNGNNTVSIKWVNDITYTYIIAGFFIFFLYAPIIYQVYMLRKDIKSLKNKTSKLVE